MDEPHPFAAVRHIELNPLRARPIERPEDWPWSGAAAHLAGKDDALVTAKPMLELVTTFVPDRRAHLDEETPEQTLAGLRLHERTGRPPGTAASWALRAPDCVLLRTVTHWIIP